MRLIASIGALVMLCVLAGCGGGGGGQASPPPDPNAHPWTGTWRMVDGNATLTIASDGKATLHTTDGQGRWVTFSGTVSTAGALKAFGKDSTGVGVRVWAAFTRHHEYLQTDALYMSFSDSPGTSRSYPNVSFKRA